MIFQNIEKTDIKSLLKSFIEDNHDPEINFSLGVYYENLGQYSSAGTYYLRASERYEDENKSYECLLRISQCLVKLTRRNFSAKGMLQKAITILPRRPEAYYLLNQITNDHHSDDDRHLLQYRNCKLALSICDFNAPPLKIDLPNFYGKHSLINQKYLAAWGCGYSEECRNDILSLINDKEANENIKKEAIKSYFQLKKQSNRSKYFHNQSYFKNIYTHGLAKYAIENHGSIHPIIIPHSITKGKSITNASVFVDENNNISLNVREMDYALFYSDKFPESVGPMNYLKKENDQNANSENIYCTLDENMNIVSSNKIDMKFNETPNWNYQGLEDARLVEWNGKKYICGVRRDHIKDGIGRMDISEIQVTDKGVIEIDRLHVPTPENEISYCEKNWMPILDKPFHFVKWTNPTQVVEFNPKTLLSKTVILDGEKTYDLPRDLRGGSQVIEWENDYYLAITHECEYSETDTGRSYRQRIVVWDKDWNVVNTTREFSLSEGRIEFVTGIAYYKDDVLISYGYEDNCAFVLRIPKEAFKDFVLQG